MFARSALASGPTSRARALATVRVNRRHYVPARQHVAAPVRFQPKKEGQEAFDDAKRGARKAADSVQEGAAQASDEVAEGVDQVEGQARDAARDAQGAARDAKGDLQIAGKQGSVRQLAAGYGAAAIACTALSVAMLVKPEALVSALYSAVVGDGLQALLGVGSALPFMTQLVGLTLVPLVVNLMVLGYSAEQGQIACDSSRRLNTSVLAWAPAAGLALSASATVLGIKHGVALLACGALPAFLAVVALAGSSEGEGGPGEMLKSFVYGVPRSLGRLLKVDSGAGAIYGCLCFGALACAAWWGFRADPATMIKTVDAEGKLAVVTSTARAGLLKLATRLIAANFLLMSVTYSALKELADKFCLSTTTARLLNFSGVILFVGYGVLSSWAEQMGMTVAGSWWMSQTPLQVCALLMAVSLVLMLDPVEQGNDIRSDNLSNRYS